MTTQNDPIATADLSGRSAIITGAGSGIGRAMALTMARSGAEILVNDIIAERVAETVALIEQAGGKALGAVGDVSIEADVQAFVDAAMTRWGKIDILCNNAGIMDDMSFLEDTSTDLWRRIFAVNVDGVFFAARAVLPHMRKAGKGAIVNTASVAGLRGGAAGGAYVASKHAVVGLTRSIAWSHGTEGVRCNAICPGAIETNITGGRGLEAFDPTGLARTLPVMALCEKAAGPQAIANVALFMASDAAFYMNGVVMPVDGGWMAG